MDEEEGRFISSIPTDNLRLKTNITDKYVTLSHIRVDAHKVPCAIGMSPLGFPIFIQEFEVIYMYGGTEEIKAQLAWEEDVCIF